MEKSVRAAIRPTFGGTVPFFYQMSRYSLSMRVNAAITAGKSQNNPDKTAMLFKLFKLVKQTNYVIQSEI